jgi:hypothetical protein
MAVFRFLASLFLLIAVIALVSDATPWSYGAGPLKSTSLAEHWAAISPTSLEGAKTAVMHRTLPFVWSGILAPVLSVPTFLMFGLLGVACGYAGRRRHKVNIYVN